MIALMSCVFPLKETTSDDFHAILLWYENIIIVYLNVNIRIQIHIKRKFSSCVSQLTITFVYEGEYQAKYSVPGLSTAK